MYGPYTTLLGRPSIASQVNAQMTSPLEVLICEVVAAGALLSVLVTAYVVLLLGQAGDRLRRASENCNAPRCGP